MTAIRVAALAELDASTWHDLCRLRVDVFVVEQACAYAELDGRDAEPSALHVWSADEQGPAAYLRLLTEPDGTRRIGRVCTAARARGASLAAVLMHRALALCGPGAVVVLDAQSHLSGWYERLGFVVDGEEFVEDGIPHVPMRGAGTATPSEEAGPRATRVTANLPSVAGPDDVAFFAAVLGLRRVTMDQGWVRRLEADSAPAHLQLVTRDATAPEDSRATVRVDDLDAAYAAALAGGYNIVHPPTTEPWGIRRFFVRSPGGAVVNVASDAHAQPRD